MSFTLRPQQPEDRSAIATLLAQTYKAEGVKAIEMATDIRKAEGYNAALCPVGEQEGFLVGYAACVPVTIDAATGAVMLAQMAVENGNEDADPILLIQQLCMYLSKEGYTSLLMFGEEGTMAREGFKLASDHGIHSAEDREGHRLLVKALGFDTALPQGQVNAPDYVAF